MNIFKNILGRNSTIESEKSLDWHVSLDSISIYAYYQASKDVRHIIKGVDHFKLPDVSSEELENLEGAYMSLIEDDSGGSIKDPKFNLILSISRLRNKYNIISGCLSILRFKYYPNLTYDFDKAEKTLESFGYKLKYKEQYDFYLELDRCFKKATGIVNQIKSKTDKLNKEISKEEKTSLFDNVAMLNRALGVKIDVYNDSMSMYRSYIKEANRTKKPS